MHLIDICSANGRKLSEVRAKGANTMYAMAEESLPKFAMLYGPNGDLGHNSVVADDRGAEPVHQCAD
jgi:hypothetical protein